MAIRISYRCSCMAFEVTVDVPERREDEDILEWMQNCVNSALYLDHRTRSPGCSSTKIEYVALPVAENAPFIGAAPKMDC